MIIEDDPRTWPPERITAHVADMKAVAGVCDQALLEVGDLSSQGTTISFVLAKFLGRNEELKRDGFWILWQRHVSLMLSGGLPTGLHDAPLEEKVFHTCHGLLSTLQTDGQVFMVLVNLLTTLAIIQTEENYEPFWEALREAVDVAIGAQSQPSLPH